MTRASRYWALSALLWAACPEGQAPAGSPAEGCARIGERCRLSDGPMGVCNDTGQRDCATPPCLACMPQH